MTSKRVGRGWSAFCTRTGTCPAPLLRFSFPACMRYMIAFCEATVRMYTFARWRLAIRAPNSFPSWATSVYPTYPIPEYLCSSCIGKARLSLRSRLGDWVESERLKVGPFVVSVNQKFDFDCATTELETLLITSGAIIPPKRPPADDLDDESDEDDSSQMRSKSTWANHKNVRNASKNGDSDSDFDL